MKIFFNRLRRTRSSFKNQLSEELSRDRLMVKNTMCRSRLNFRELSGSFSFSCLVTVIFGLFFLGTSTVFAEQDNFSMDEKPLVFRIIDKTGEEKPTDDGVSDASGSNSQYPQMGEVRTLSLSFLGTLVIGAELFMILWRRRENDEKDN